MKIIIKNAVLLLMFLLILPLCKVKGQNIFYECDFEDSIENSQWKLNYGKAGSKCANQWYIGQPGAFMGDNGLFVSKDGESNLYLNKGVLVVAMRDSILLDAGSYDFSFQLQAEGMSDDGLYVCWIPCSDTHVNVSSIPQNLNYALPEFVKDYSLKFGSRNYLNLTSSWKNIASTLNSDGGYYRLVWLWINGNVGAYPPAACIDNILIRQKNTCLDPWGLKVRTEGDSVVFSWNATSDLSDVKVTNATTGEWFEYNHLSTDSVVLTNLGEGVCTFFVRSVCDDVNSAWVFKEQFIYFSLGRCIDYLDLNEDNCYYGHVGNPKQEYGVINFGPEEQGSRHTIHIDQKEYDKRTGGLLKTIPPGEVASVRLGNWSFYAQAECIEYVYTIDTNESAVFELKYAVVLQDPEDHPVGGNPRFELDILKNGKPIDVNGCGEAKFEAGSNTDDASWHIYYDEDKEGNMTKGWWKDWTTVGINLRKYHGEKLTVRLTTYDCVQSGHYGYAYFTINCNNGRLEALNCGNDTVNEFVAPDGFKYKWYNPKNPEVILGTQRKYTIQGNDTATYYVDVIQPTNDSCYYTLIASGLSRWPVADFSHDFIVSNCQYAVNFTNKSYIKYINQKNGEEKKSGLPCDSYFWDFGDGTTSENEHCEHVYKTGGKYIVTLKSYIAGKCFDVKTMELDLPELGATTVTKDTVICVGDVFEFKGLNHTIAGAYSDTLISQNGCDSIFTYNLIINDTINVYLKDTITSDDEFIFGDQIIAESGIYVDTLVSFYGCDSIVVLDIEVEQITRIIMDSIISVCADDQYIVIPYEISEGRLRSFDVKFTDENIASLSASNLIPEESILKIPITINMRPGVYSGTILYGGDLGASNNFILQVLYPDTILTQRWNDVLAVKNTQYNGNYNFVSYQWFKNGAEINGATSSILYLEGGLDFDATYSVLLTRADDLSSDMTCGEFRPIQYELLNDEQKINFSVKNDNLIVNAEVSAVMRLWTSTGVLIKTCQVDEGLNIIENSVFMGCYILEFILEDGSRFIEHIIF